MLKYHESGKQALVEPSVGQWNMIDKVFNPNPLVRTCSADPGKIEKALLDIHHESDAQHCLLSIRSVKKVPIPYM
ncbi:protein argonaute 5-like [Andrographis paniculata]|uniref:protein argonaute 5-like n=1 Tax=Andrographis paniculata TaxID=175694 RepID=UPI0021E728D4|nr:protein argonaute 5-like [Andrographis paniculata]